MPTKKSQLKTYVDEKTAKKITLIAENNCRTISKQLEFIIKKEINNFEKENGEIKL